MTLHFGINYLEPDGEYGFILGADSLSRNFKINPIHKSLEVESMSFKIPFTERIELSEPVHLHIDKSFLGESFVGFMSGYRTYEVKDETELLGRPYSCLDDTFDDLEEGLVEDAAWVLENYKFYRILIAKKTSDFVELYTIGRHKKGIVSESKRLVRLTGDITEGSSFFFTNSSNIHKDDFSMYYRKAFLGPALNLTDSIDFAVDFLTTQSNFPDENYAVSPSTIYKINPEEIKKISEDIQNGKNNH